MWNRNINNNKNRKRLTSVKLSEGIKEAYQRKWSMINTFTVQIILPPALIGKVGVLGDELNLNIISVLTPDFTNDPIEAFIANKWFIHNGKDQLYRFSITFRDQDQMKLYRKFMTIYNFAKENYFDDIKMTIIIMKDGDWDNEYDKSLMTLDGALVEGVSNLSFSNDTENQIAEFTVNFKCNAPYVLDY